MCLITTVMLSKTADFCLTAVFFSFVFVVSDAEQGAYEIKR